LVPKEREATHWCLKNFYGENEQVEESNEDEGGNLWSAMDEAVGASQGLRGRNLPRSVAAATSSQPHRTYVRIRKEMQQLRILVKNMKVIIKMMSVLQLIHLYKLKLWVRMDLNLIDGPLLLMVMHFNCMKICCCRAELVSLYFLSFAYLDNSFQSLFVEQCLY
jgi:hypothetical protein